MGTPVMDGIKKWVEDGVDKSYVLYMIHNICALKGGILLSFGARFAATAKAGTGERFCSAPIAG
jgi:hypothetical protein